VLIGFLARTTSFTFSLWETTEVSKMIDEMVDERVHSLHVEVQELTATVGRLEQRGNVEIDTIHAMLKAMQDGQKIEAIKAHRSLTGYGLKESKDIIEKYWTRNPEIG